MPPKLKKIKALQQKAKAAQRGNSKSSSYVGSNGPGASFVPFEGTASPRRGQSGFTLQEEARNTDRHQSFWNTDQRLRHRNVKFVSAGTIDPRDSESKEAEDALAEMTLGPPREDVKVEEEPFREPAPVVQVPDIEEELPVLFAVDTVGEPVNIRLPPPQIRSTSPSPSNSSEEVILFGGRDGSGRAVARAPTVYRQHSSQIDAKIKIIDDQIHQQEELLNEVLREESASPPRLNPQIQKQSLPSKVNHERSLPIRERIQDRNKADEDAIVADYMANMDKDEVLNHFTFRSRDLGGAENGVWQDDSEDYPEDTIQDTVEPIQSRWARSDICDFDQLSTSDEAMGAVQEILSKRERESGTQYLVVWQNQTIDDARWVSISTLTAVGALSLVEKFESEEKLVANGIVEEDEDSSELDYTGISDREDDEDEEKDLLDRTLDRMSDEQIAIMLAKQEELGMGSDELKLFGVEADAEVRNEVVVEEDTEDGMAIYTNGLNPSLLGPTIDRFSNRGARRPRGDFPSATALADSYDGFDVLDFERPSLKRKPKGRKGNPVFDPSDSELEASMQTAFETNRFKKKGKKQEREELRAQGLLGSKNGKLVLKEKFKEGMSIHEVKDEIKSFLMGDSTTLSLPPMDKADRKVVHELAAVFYLKSKSVGGGKSRAPVLMRTSRTPPFVERNFDLAEAKLSRRFLPRMDVGGKKRAQRAPRGGNNAGVSYRDGDVVGGSAPELGIENKGRAMLEKMGWSTGTALGALNNKGILQPVSHVVKTTKAGLG